jgi:cytolysin-activating lysine-acyltransferase
MAKTKASEKKVSTDTPKNDNQAVPATLESVFGAISWLMLQSPAHRHLFLADLEWLIMPALQSKQFRLVRQENKPVAYVSWASVNEETEARIKQGMTKLKPAEWQQGESLWIIDVIAPFGGTQQVFKQLNETQFKGKEVKLLRQRKDGKGAEVVLLADLVSEGEKAKDKVN